jgi:hypothetical protein
MEKDDDDDNPCMPSIPTLEEGGHAEHCITWGRPSLAISVPDSGPDHALAHQDEQETNECHVFDGLPASQSTSVNGMDSFEAKILIN